jgi:TolB-like protein/Tfp pilus assembly protein PilF
MFAGPLGWWKGLAEAQAGHEAAARLHLQAALQLVERRLAEAPSSYRLIAWKGRLLASLGEKAAAEKSLHLAWEMGGDKNHWDRWPDQMLIGETDQVVEELEKIRQNYPGAHWSARLRLNPEFDPLRRNARFLALLSQLDADPRSSPTAPAVPAASSLSPALAAPLPVDQKSVAVLAFANLSDDKANEYFSDGISEELLNVLAKVPGLKVTARTSSFHFKGKDTPIPEIAQQLGVAYVIEGSVRKQGDKVRITAQLIKAADGFHVWSDTFTRNLKDIFAVQDEIAGLIAQQLQLKLGDTAEIKKVVNPEAYRLVLEGRHYWLQRTDEAFARAQEAYAKALVIDPGFADAHAGIADVFVVRGWYHALSGASVTAADFARAREEATLALRLDPTLVAPHATLAAVNYNEGRFSEAELAFKDALRLNPNYAVALHWRSHLLMAQGRPDEALASIERSIELDPFSSITLVIYANWLEHTGRNADAVAVTERAMVLRNDQYIPLYGTRALALWNVGRRDEAVAAARVVTRDPKQEPRWWVDGSVVYVLRQAGLVDEARAHMTSMRAELSEGSTARAAVFAGMGEPDRAIAELARPERRLAGPGETYYTSVWAATRRDPRYRELIEKIGCAEFYQRAQETLARLQGARK